MANLNNMMNGKSPKKRPYVSPLGPDALLKLPLLGTPGPKFTSPGGGNPLMPFLAEPTFSPTLATSPLGNSGSVTTPLGDSVLGGSAAVAGVAITDDPKVGEDNPVTEPQLGSLKFRRDVRPRQHEYKAQYGVRLEPLPPGEIRDWHDEDTTLKENSIPRAAKTNPFNATLRLFYDVILPIPITTVLLLLCLALALAIRESKDITTDPTFVEVRGKSLYVNDTLFIVKGVAYQPIWSGVDARYQYPFGDVMYTTSVRQSSYQTGYRDYNRFHLRKISKTFNTIRLYNWLLEKEHLEFLDDCHELGLKVIITFWMDSVNYPDLEDHSVLKKLKVNFAHLVRMYRSHPAVLMWAISNEPNLESNPNAFYGQLPAFFQAVKLLREIRDEEESIEHGFFPHPMMVPMANSEVVRDQMEKYDGSTGFDIWGLQPYVGPDRLNDMMLQFSLKKPILLSEYGADSFVDFDIGTSAFLHSGRRYPLMEANQTESLIELTKVITKYLSDKDNITLCSDEVCPPNSVTYDALPNPRFVKVGDYKIYNQGVRDPLTHLVGISFVEQGDDATTVDEVVESWENGSLRSPYYEKLIGGAVFEWMDEWWKGSPLDPDHPNCDVDEADVQSTCGGQVRGFGIDQRLNEEWLGISSQNVTASTLCLAPKPAIASLSALFAVTNGSFYTDCASESCCVELPAQFLLQGYTMEMHLLAVSIILLLLVITMAIVRYLTLQNKNKEDTKVFPELEPPTWISKAPGSGPSMHSERHERGDTAPLASRSTPLGDVEAFLPFAQVRAFLETETNAHKALSDMSWALANPVLWDGNNWAPRGSVQAMAAEKKSKPWKGATEPVKSKLPLCVGDVVVVNCQYEDGDAKWSLGKLTARNKDDNCTVKLSTPLVISTDRKYLYKSSTSPPFMAGDPVYVKINGMNQEGVVKNTDYKVEVAKVQTHVSHVKSAVTVKFPERIRDVQLTDAFAQAVIANHRSQKPTMSDIKTRPRYNMTLAYEAYVHAVGQALLRRSFKYHSGSEAHEIYDLLSLEGNDFFANIPHDVMVDALKDAHDAILPPECLEQNSGTVETKLGSSSWDGSFNVVTRALLFLVLQQRVDSLRQSKWLKTIMYLHVMRASDNSFERKKKVLSALRDVVNVSQHHLELVKADTINYADVDEIYQQIYNTFTGTSCCWSLVQDQRSCGPNHELDDILHIVHIGETLRKTFPERLSWTVPIRLFSFTLHFHILLYYGTLAVQMNFSWGLTWWLIAAAEACLCIANRLIDIWMFPLPHFYYKPSLLSIIELALSFGVVVLRYKPGDSAGDTDRIPINIIGAYLACMWVSQLIIRPLSNMQLRNKLAAPRFLKWRALTLCAMLLIQALLAWFIITPSVATLSLNVCKCPELNLPFISHLNNGPTHCVPTGNDVICVTSLVLIFVVSFISLNLLAHVNYMFLSIICGYIVGFIKKLGTVKQWPGAQVVLNSLLDASNEPSPMEVDARSGQVVPDLSIYGNFTPDIPSPGIHVKIEKCVKVKGPLIVESFPLGDEDSKETQKIFAGETPKFHAVFTFRSTARAIVFKVSRDGEHPMQVEAAVRSDSVRMHHRLRLPNGGCLDVAIRRVSEKPYTGPTPEQFAMHNQLSMIRNIFQHMFERDLISKSQYEMYTRWNFELTPPEEALIHILQFLNGAAGLKALFPSETTPVYLFSLLQKKVSVFAMKSITFFVPYYSETVLYTMKELIKNGILEHMVDLWSDEWTAFVERNFFGLQDTERVLAAAKQGELHILWNQLREEYESGCKVGRRRWGEYVWRYDGPPMSSFEDVRMDGRHVTNADEEAYKRKARYWIELQVRVWCSMRGQTLMRNVFGLCDMREAVVDLAYYEMKSAQGCRWVADHTCPTERSSITEVLGWIVTNSSLPKQWRDSLQGCFTKVNNVAYHDYVCHAVLYFRINGARLFSADKSWKYHRMDWSQLLGSPELLNNFIQWNKDHKRVGSDVLENIKKKEVCEALANQVQSAIAISAEANALREKAEILVSTKIQLCFGAQVYFANETVRRATNELLRMDRVRHLELATDQSKGSDFKSTHVARKGAPINRTNFLEQFGEPVDSGKRCNSCGHPKAAPFCSSTGEPHEMEIIAGWRDDEGKHIKMTTFDRQAQLKLGEGKAENQNNMITCARGEILNILDMNQDGYYSEGIKLPFITNLWSEFDSSTVEEGYTPQREDTYQVMGFREHIFTQSHSAVGRYMALAEFSFVTLIQRFLASPHEVRMHYGHPDMVNAYLMKQTGGVSRASLSVNVNEDIFLGYEMAQNGRRICMIENMSFGKGREVDFNNASTFLKKLSAGCVMQLSSREVHNLYTRVLSLSGKWALFYGSIAHFINIFLMDLSIFAFTYALMFFSLADVTPQVLRLNESPLSDPWLFQIGMFYIVPMLVEMNLEHSYLKLSDFVMSIPFFSHQNRITASFFSYTMQICSAKYLGTDRGMGNLPRRYVDFFVDHTWTNFIPAFKLFACVIVFWWGSNGCDLCHSESGMVRLWIVIVSAVSYLSGPALYNPKPSFTSIWNEATDTLGWMNARVPSRYCRNTVGVDVADFMGHAKSGGAKKSLTVFWIFEWLEYLNSKALDAQGSRVAALGVLAKELVVILLKYIPWAAVVYFALAVSRGVGNIEIKHDLATGNVTTIVQDVPMHTVRPPVVFLIVIDVFFWEVGNAVTYLFATEGSLSTVPRLINLVVLPILLLVAIVTAFAYGGKGFWETVRDTVGYMFFAGVAFSLLTDLYLALMQFGTSVLSSNTQEAFHLVQTLYDSETWKAFSESNPRTCTECRKSGIPLEKDRCPHCKTLLTPLAHKVKGTMRHCVITDVYKMADKVGKPEVMYSVKCDSLLALQKKRLWHLIFVARWSPLMMYFRRMYYLVLLFLAVPSGLAAALASIHTTWLFNEKVAKRQSA